MRQSRMLIVAALWGCMFWAAAEDAATPAACPQQADGAAKAADFNTKFKQADANQDGQVTFEEASGAFPQVTREQFAQYDRNGDGIVTSADAPAASQGGHQGKMALLAQADADGNKQVTYEELVAVAPKMTPERFKQLDKNGDGVLSAADRSAHKKGGSNGVSEGAPKVGKGDRMALMKKADKDGNQQVTFEELAAVAPKMTPERFKQLDKNGDGVLTVADRPARHEGGPEAVKGDRMALMKKADKDGNQQVTYDELVAVAPKMTPERFKQLDKNGDSVLTVADRPAHHEGGPKDISEGGQKAVKGDKIAMLKKADADNDGQVTFEELQAAKPDISRERFDKIDRNHDGVLSEADKPAEIPAEAPPTGQQEGKVAPGDKLAKLQKADVNKDQKVTFEELQAVAPNFTRERFDKADRNHDGVLSPQDRVGPADRVGPEGKPDGKGAGLADKIRKADTNGDGKTTYEEVTAAKPGVPREAFDKLDTNKDGVLSKEDAPATK